MSEENKRVKELEEAIEKIENKESNLYFFVYDTKGVPAGSLAYIYETALYLYEKGYNVKMVHAEKEDFVGVRSWLGDKYADLPHFNNGTDKLTVGPADFIFIPEIYFPKNSADIWEKCDVLVTADPKLLSEKPEGKKTVKIEMPYNEGIEADFTYSGLDKFIEEGNDIIEKLK